MRAIKLKTGNLLIPIRAEGPDGLIGDGMLEVKPGSTEYNLWEPTSIDSSSITDQIKLSTKEP